MTIRVLLADDQAMIRGGLRLILDDQPDISVVGEAADGTEAIRLRNRVEIAAWAWEAGLTQPATG
jgi:YesN/AraC family two-component response regulator